MMFLYTIRPTYLHTINNKKLSKVHTYNTLVNNQKLSKVRWSIFAYCFIFSNY